MQDSFFYGRPPRHHSHRWLLLVLPGLLAIWLFAAPVAMAEDPVGDAIGTATDTASSNWSARVRRNGVTPPQCGRATDAKAGGVS